MAKRPSKDRSRPTGDPEDPARAATPSGADATPAEGEAATRAEEPAERGTGADVRQPATAIEGDASVLRPSGRDDDLDGDIEGERSVADRTVPSLEGSPIAPEARDDHPAAAHVGEHEEHHARPSFAATALKALIFGLVIFGLSLWLVPMLAPHLPAGLARVLMPGQAELDQRLAMLAGQIEASTGRISTDVAAMQSDIAALSDRLGSAEQTAGGARSEAEAARQAAEESAASAKTNVVAGETVARAEAAAREASGLADTATTAATEAGKVASAAARDTASLARRMTDFDARLAALSDQIDAVNESLASGAGRGEAAVPELQAAVAGLKSQVESLRTEMGEADLVTETEAQRFATQDDLRSARTALEAEIGKAVAALPPAPQIVLEDQLDQLRRSAEAKVQEVAGRVDTLEKAAAEVSQTATAAEQAASAAVGRVDDAIREASLRSAAAALTSRLANGLPYAGALEEAAKLQGSAPPPALAASAETGVATTAELLRRFGQPARAAQQAAIEARAGEGLLAQAEARLMSVVAGRPASEQPGESVDAVLSRIEARLREEDPAAALAEAEALAEPAKAALGSWLGELRARVAAMQASADWLGPVGAEPGASGTGG
jgi:hypothetical protein